MFRSSTTQPLPPRREDQEDSAQPGDRSDAWSDDARALPRFLPILAVLASLLLAPSAAAFCGFYVAGADAQLTNDATTVVLMRDGTRVVLSMQNDYRGPWADFAMVVPVPVVLERHNVKTLPHDVFDRIDKLSSPRLVEYWERDPCYEPPSNDDDDGGNASPTRTADGAAVQRADKPTVTVEAQFEVGEYEVVVLSATDSTGLETWLRDHDYTMPANAEPLLRPYVAQGSKFFVARVDVDKLRNDDGRARLSPLRFHYDSERFVLPVRLGLINSGGRQDLIVHVLARERYEVANYPNVFVPTNIDVSDGVREQFGAFYNALLERVFETAPGSVVTEYAWDFSSKYGAKCDPCPVPPMRREEMLQLGADVVPQIAEYAGVHTRLHLRYGADALGEDLVFRRAKPVRGGREMGREGGGRLEEGAQPSSANAFQARYAIRHAWKGSINCLSPVRGLWGEPPADYVGPTNDTIAASRDDLAGNVALETMVMHGVPELGLSLAAAPRAYPGEPPGLGGACAGCTVGAEGSPWRSAGAWLAGAAVALVAWRRRSSPQQSRPRGGRRA
jgi:MYXO-CTERM domain-containing protein